MHAENLTFTDLENLPGAAAAHDHWHCRLQYCIHTTLSETIQPHGNTDHLRQDKVLSLISNSTGLQILPLQCIYSKPVDLNLFLSFPTLNNGAHSSPTCRSDKMVGQA